MVLFNHIMPVGFEFVSFANRFEPEEDVCGSRTYHPDFKSFNESFIVSEVLLHLNWRSHPSVLAEDSILPFL